VLEVYANLAPAREPVHRQFVRVRQIEAESVIPHPLRQVRLSLCTVAKLHLARVDTQVIAKDHPEHTVTHDETSPVARKVKALRPRQLVRRKRLSQTIEHIRRLLERGLPNVNLVIT